MPTPANPSLESVDWSRIPPPVDDGGARHLTGLAVPDIALVATDGATVSLANAPGRTVLFAYPRTGQPGSIGLVDDWDMIPGARGCTPQSCAFRDLYRDLLAAGADRVYGLSSQNTDYQREAVARLHLPYALLSDAGLQLTRALPLPTMDVAGQTLIRRLAMVVDDARIVHVLYPVFPPDRNAADVLVWLRANPR